MIINSIEVTDYFRRAYVNLMGNKYLEGYAHMLYPEDAKPLVIHKETYQITVVLSGSGHVVVNGDLQAISENDLIFIEANKTHQFMAATPLTLFHIHIPFETENSDRYIIQGKDFILH